ncbi:hypothetical protein PCL_04661 [Purpureocillium lilacinum]|uniref:Uncharacterized protein n=1 Tax=Purpureocillium lilacinum TaxID=33203 RepID=A0A2U3DX51_PURLI|nr:hypothetical protein Purlil1_4486 [Purpureocillium lilacinum]PWI66817.1 hypothetical protein PCL_04661 [Purpureocillium lilacinum]
MQKSPYSLPCAWRILFFVVVVSPTGRSAGSSGASPPLQLGTEFQKKKKWPAKSLKQDCPLKRPAKVEEGSGLCSLGVSPGAYLARLSVHVRSDMRRERNRPYNCQVEVPDLADRPIRLAAWPGGTGVFGLVVARTGHRFAPPPTIPGLSSSSTQGLALLRAARRRANPQIQNALCRKHKRSAPVPVRSVMWCPLKIAAHHPPGTAETTLTAPLSKPKTRHAGIGRRGMMRTSMLLQEAERAWCARLGLFSRTSPSTPPSLGVGRGRASVVGSAASIAHCPPPAAGCRRAHYYRPLGDLGMQAPVNGSSSDKHTCQPSSCSGTRFHRSPHLAVSTPAGINTGDPSSLSQIITSFPVSAIALS